MPWWLVWVLLAVAALGFLIWVGLRLWRSFRALIKEVQAAQLVMERLSETVARLEEAAGEAEQIEARLLLSQDEREEIRQERADVRAQRRARKNSRYKRAVTSWDQLTGAPASHGDDVHP